MNVPQRLQRLVESNAFHAAVTLVIVVAGAVVGLETYPQLTARYGPVLDSINAGVVGLFVLEILLKWGADWPRPWRFFKDPWNVFDFLIVAASFIPEGGEYASVLRLARLLRVLRLVGAVPRLQILVNALLRSIPSMMYVAVLLGLMFYVYAVAGVVLFGGNDPVHFRDLPTAMLSLFRVVTLEDWTDIMYLQMFGCDVYDGYNGDAFAQTCTQPVARPLLGAAYFVSFVLLGTMIFLNLFIGVILNGMDEAQAEQEEEERQARRSEGIPSLADDADVLAQHMKELQHQLLRIQHRIRTERPALHPQDQEPPPPLRRSA